LLLVLAMNRLRHGYLTMAPGLKPYFSTGHHDDLQGLAATLLVAGPRELHPWVHFLTTTRRSSRRWMRRLRPRSWCCSSRPPRHRRSWCGRGRGRRGVPSVWGALFSLHVWTVRALRTIKPRFPTPAQDV
jgi:hypothetical protein